MATQVQTDALATTIDAVRTNLRLAPETAVATFTADTTLVDGYRTTATIRDFSLTIDEPPLIGGGDAGPTPVELVLAALGTCQEIVYATYARILDIPLHGVSVQAAGNVDLRGFFGVTEVPAGFRDVTFTVAIDSPAPAADVARLVNAVNAHCPVLDILRQPVPTTGSYLLNGAPLAIAAA